MSIEKHCTALLFSISPQNKDRIEQAFNNHKKLMSHAELSAPTQVVDGNLKHYSSCFRMSLRSRDTDFNLLLMRQAFDDFATEIEADYYFFVEGEVRGRPKFAVFDMDSTLIPMEVIDELAAEFGVKDKVADITEEAMRGELDFNQSFEKRLSILSGMPRKAVESVQQRISLNPGVKALTSYLIDSGAEIGIASGGFKDFARQIGEQLGVHEIKANALDFNEKDELTGKANFPIVNAELKARTLTEWAESRGLKLNETMAVGDGANDWLMLKSAGFGVAYKAKDYLKYRADCVLQFAEMDGLIDILKIVTK
ncbi:hypothetical protein GCM10009123_09020 [Kangiella japonica]|uniref:Phosphoserine phosphatase n=1 Tax=Kangiella japonica TaxID=647384 RepID=A0ABN0SWG4_9GAMM